MSTIGMNKKIKLPLKIIQDENRLTINLVDNKTSDNSCFKSVETRALNNDNINSCKKEINEQIVDLDKIEHVIIKNDENSITGEYNKGDDDQEEQNQLLLLSFQSDDKNNNKKNKHLRDIIIESGDNWSHFIMPFIRLGELKSKNQQNDEKQRENSSSRKLMDQFNKVKQQYEQRKLLSRSKSPLKKKQQQQPQQQLSAKFFNFDRILNRRNSTVQKSVEKESNQSILNTKSKKKQTRSASSSVKFDFSSCCKSSSSKNKRISVNDVDLIRSNSPLNTKKQSAFNHHQNLFKLFKSNKHMPFQEKLIKKNLQENKNEDYDNFSIHNSNNNNDKDKVSNTSNYSPPITVATSTNKSRSNVDLFRMLKSSSSTGSAQTNTKLDALKFEIDRTMNEISLFKQNSNQNTLLYSTYHQQLLEIDRLLVNFNKFNETLNSALNSATGTLPNTKMVNDIGVNTDISMYNATFTIKYDDDLHEDDSKRFVYLFLNFKFLKNLLEFKVI
jgi:hypothetical protein